MYKARNNELPNKLQSIFNMKAGNKYETRKCQNFNVKICKTKIASVGRSITGVRLWNALNRYIKRCKSLIKFQAMLKSLYISNNYLK